jgi:hypothetical protein
MNGLSNLRGNVDAYRWWVHPRDRFDDFVSSSWPKGTATTRREAEKAAIAACVKECRQKTEDSFNNNINNTSATLLGPRAKWVLNPMWRWVRR